jgi:hypothetical protein
MDALEVTKKICKRLKENNYCVYYSKGHYAKKPYYMVNVYWGKNILTKLKYKILYYL